MQARTASIRLTGRELDEVHSILYAILTNPDQWVVYDLAALRRVDNKIINTLLEETR